jgi:hypothetical protein
MPEVQEKLDIINIAPEYYCLVCDQGAPWNMAIITENRCLLCPKCLDKGMLVTVAEYRDEDYFNIYQGAWERMNAIKVELGYPPRKRRKKA